MINHQNFVCAKIGVPYLFQTKTPLPTYSILQQGPLPLTTSELYKPIIQLRCSTGTKPAEMKLVVEHTRSCVRYLEILYLE